MEQLNESKKKKKGEEGEGDNGKHGPVKTMNRATLVTPRCSVHNKRGKETAGEALFSTKADKI